MKKIRLLRITTVPISLKILLHGQLTFFNQNGFEILAVSANGTEINALREQGISHEVVAMTRKITPIQDVICLLHLVRLIIKFRPDIVHTHTPKAGLLGMMAAWLCRVQIRMHTVAGLPLMEKSGLLRRILIFTERITYACATAVYPNSVGLKKYIETFSSTKLSIIGKGSSNGINTEFFNNNIELDAQAKQIRTHYGITDKDVVFSFVGRIVKDKGIGELVQAFKKLLNSQSISNRFFLLLVGSFEQDLDPLPKDDFDFLHNSSSVVLAGFQTDIRPYVIASDIFVFPSYREGFPNVVMQAACLKVPAIVSDINGCNEIIQHEQTGLIVRPKDPDELYSAMSSLAKDKNKQRKFGEASRKYVTDHFDQKKIWAALLKEYNSLFDWVKD